MNSSHFYAAHPSACPEINGPLPYLIHPPGELSSTARWIDFRDRTLLPMMRSFPDDKELPKFLRQVGVLGSNPPNFQNLLKSMI